MHTTIASGLIAIALAIGASAAIADEAAGPSKGALKFRKVETKNYVVEVPKGWEVTEETSFGQREIHPPKDAGNDTGGSMSSMTGPGLGRQSWDQLYQTSLYFITRYPGRNGKMTATEYKLGKSKQGFETCSWTMMNADNRPVQQHVILKHTNGNILAVSVKIPPAAAKGSKERLEAIFRHLVDTAVVK